MAHWVGTDAVGDGTHARVGHSRMGSHKEKGHAKARQEDISHYTVHINN